ncbi:hypothetical protein FACS189479_05590 [Spirochaetia bacterium]|nr:hypothetical protein FACS189479_05590 [Spirochaetia bacterium]
MENSGIDYQNALEFISEYYNRTWNSLLWVIGTAFVVIGVIIPYLQQKISKGSIKKLENELKAYTEKFTNLEIDVWNTQGDSLEVRGNILIQYKTYPEALSSFLQALVFYIDAENDKKIKKMFDVVNSVFENQEAGIRKSFKIDAPLTKPLENVINKIKEKNKSGRYDDDLHRLEYILSLSSEGENNKAAI